MNWYPLGTIGTLLLTLAACVSPKPGHVQLVETTPVGTVLGSPDLPETSQVWREMIAGADETLDLCHFYLVAEDSGLLDPIVAMIEDAAADGVRVRILVGEKFYGTYPELIDRFAGNQDLAIRRLDLSQVTGGVQHSKYMVVDGEDVYVGSANFDWRALEHIQELGLRMRSPEAARSVLDVFDYDWALANGEPTPQPQASAGETLELFMDPGQVRRRFDNRVTVQPAFSPTGLLPHASQWDLPQIVELIDGAQKNLFLQLLTLDLVDPGGQRFEELEGAIQRAAQRGVRVRILVADWSDREGVIEGLRDLAALDQVSVRMISIPEHSGGHIPFARVIHAKYLVVDREAAWLGSSNWERGYFFESRNVGWIIRGQGFADRLEHFFRTNWSSPYVRDVWPTGAATSGEAQ